MITFKKGTHGIQFAFKNSCGNMECRLKVGRLFYSLLGETLLGDSCIIQARNNELRNSSRVQKRVPFIRSLFVKCLLSSCYGLDIELVIYWVNRVNKIQLLPSGNLQSSGRFDKQQATTMVKSYTRAFRTERRP